MGEKKKKKRRAAVTGTVFWSSQIGYPDKREGGGSSPSQFVLLHHQKSASSRVWQSCPLVHFHPRCVDFIETYINVRWSEDQSSIRDTDQIHQRKISRSESLRKRKTNDGLNTLSTCQPAREILGRHVFHPSGWWQGSRKGKNVFISTLFAMPDTLKSSRTQ